MTLTIAPMQWTTVRDIDDIEPVNEADTECLAEIRDILRKHGKMERFGIALLHSHFPLEDDEILLETSDHQTRTLTLKPTKQSEAGNSNVGTIWMLRDGDATTMSWCKQYCRRLGIFGHKNAHTRQK